MPDAQQIQSKMRLRLTRGLNYCSNFVCSHIYISCIVLFVVLIVIVRLTGVHKYSAVMVIKDFKRGQHKPWEEVRIRPDIKHHYIKINISLTTDPITTRIVHISDTHAEHLKLLDYKAIPDGDILVHTGDFTLFHMSYRKTVQEAMEPVERFFRKMPHKHKIYLPGNHDYALHNHSAEVVQRFLPSAIYLHDREVTIDGIKMYGTGWNRRRKFSKAQALALDEHILAEIWENIPRDTDILITHSPPYGILDQDVAGDFPAVMGCTPKVKCKHEHMGSMTLYEAVFKKIRPMAHLFGHSHFGNGWTKHAGIVFANAALATHNKLVILDYVHSDLSSFN